MRTPLGVFATALSGVLLVAPAQAAGALPTCSKQITVNCVTPESTDEGFNVDIVTDVAGSDGDGGAAGAGGGSQSPTYYEYTHVPTCSGNEAEGGNDALCGAAVDSCPVEGEIRVWVYRRTIERASGDALTPYALITDPPTRCIGADEPGIDPVTLIPAIVQRDFQRVVVLKGVAEVSPRPDTLINIPTRFSTSSPESYPIELTLLGHDVVITAAAERWTWHFGDGTSASTTAKGTGGLVEHAYTEPGSRAAHVVIEWSGTFTIDGGAPQPISGRATTTGDPVEVEVKQARAELVAD